ncbi:NUDIX hydrolase [Umezawaea tangerina]|uniref:ADP-ribose pyrophosphatase YjhB (NUDIX family) n=1 Tax=Umezawaea tangerina TaxID=84725 RepID=A0A2T0SVS5_9PSEU|nr:NUDIX domain-containing protein [Umezawaea tangerina]PRY37521.1 ADP-ribose pyrophosphatase YjhB (NUDIX family) [Umezawaea tangerina]
MSTADPLHICNVEVALWRGERWLLIRRGGGERHSAGQLALVGGKVEHDEAPGAVLENALRRETAEEVGLEPGGTPHYVTSAHFTLADGTSVVNVVFCAPAPDTEPVVQDECEVAGTTWLTAAEVAASDAPEWTKQYVAEAERIRRLVTSGSREAPVAPEGAVHARA